MSDIEKHINEHGQECYRGVTAETPFSPDLFHMPEKQFEDERQWAFHSELGSLTVVDRMTGFGWRDVESGYRDKDGKFWLASGNCYVRGSGCKTVGDAIQWVKDRANTCDPDYKPEPEPEDAKDTRIAELEAKLAAAEADLAKHKAVTEYYAEGRRGDRRYSPARIAWEIERTAMGDGHYGNALRVAKDLPEVTAEDRSLLDRYATGKQRGTDHVALQDLALRIDRAAIDAAGDKP